MPLIWRKPQHKRPTNAPFISESLSCPDISRVLLSKISPGQVSASIHSKALLTLFQGVVLGLILLEWNSWNWNMGSKSDFMSSCLMYYLHRIWFFLLYVSRLSSVARSRKFKSAGQKLHAHYTHLNLILTDHVILYLKSGSWENWGWSLVGHMTITRV